MQLALESVDVARWQFGVTTVYHFLFVPLTISLATLVAGLETAWVRTGKEHYLRATKFWGKLFLINMAMGVVTGIVQEFQFGMNWSDYSRFVGDVFGAPLAFEALIAFFFESTFIGLWIFGWDRLPKKIHLATIWITALGTILSAFFILAANSWMQHPVGYEYNAKTKRAELTDFWAVISQNTTLVQVFHTLTASFLVGGAFMIGIAAYHLARKKHIQVMRTSLRLGLTVAAVAGLLVAISGDQLGKVMYDQQPMKMAAAEALWDGKDSAPFSLFAYGDVDQGRNKIAIEVPGALSFLAESNFNAHVPGINDVNKSEQQKYADKYGANADYRPNIPTTYWTFRWMIGFGLVSFAIGVIGLWLTRRKFWLAPEHRTTDEEAPLLMLTKERPLGSRLIPWFWRLSLFTIIFPVIAAAWGWIFTEMGRQPWLVFGVLRTQDGVSPGVSTGEVITSLVVLTLLYGALAFIEVKLLAKSVKAGPPELTPADLTDPGDRGGTGQDSDKPMVFAY